VPGLLAAATSGIWFEALEELENGKAETNQRRRGAHP